MEAVKDAISGAMQFAFNTEKSGMITSYADLFICALPSAHQAQNRNADRSAINTSLVQYDRGGMLDVCCGLL